MIKLKYYKTVEKTKVKYRHKNKYTYSYKKKQKVKFFKLFILKKNIKYNLSWPKIIKHNKNFYFIIKLILVFFFKIKSRYILKNTLKKKIHFYQIIPLFLIFLKIKKKTLLKNKKNLNFKLTNQKFLKFLKSFSKFNRKKKINYLSIKTWRIFKNKKNKKNKKKKVFFNYRAKRLRQRKKIITYMILKAKPKFTISIKKKILKINLIQKKYFFFNKVKQCTYRLHSKKLFITNHLLKKKKKNLIWKFRHYLSKKIIFSINKVNKPLRIKKINKDALEERIFFYKSLINLKIFNNLSFINILNIYNYDSLKFNFNLFNINNNIFLNERSKESFVVKFYTQKFFKKKKFKKTFFFNFRTRKLKVYKNARKVHWNFFFSKNLNSRRYRNFLNLFIKKKHLFTQNILFQFILKFNLSFKFWKSFIDYYNFFFFKNLKKKQIFQFPINKFFWFFFKKYLYKKKKTVLKIKFWFFKSLKIKRTFWMQKKKKIPNFFKKQSLVNKFFKNSIQYDFLTNYFILLKNNTLPLNLLENFFFKNKYLKLHKFRFKA